MLKAVESVTNLPDHQNQIDIPMQAVSLDIWDKKYRLKSKNGDHID